jgi:hypothetical protein
MTRSIFVVCIALLLAACGAEKKEKEAMEQMAKPIDCKYAEGDLRALNSERAHTMDQIADGVTSISPVGAVAGLLEGTEGTKIKVATGDYNKAIDKRIADIKSKCGV